MNKIKSLDDLRKMKQSLEQGMTLREKSDSPDALVQIRVAMATCGIAAGARGVMSTLIETLDREKIPAIVTQGGCMGFCYAEPTVEVKLPGKDPVIFGNMTPEKVGELIDKYIRRGELTGDIIPPNYDTIHETK
jgi:NADP-reducing hydrogenase subunit HndB